MKRLFYLLLSAFLILACQGEDGEIGPAGPQGADGADGADGAQGLPGQDGKNADEKIGFMEGTVSGTRRDGTPFSEPFKYEYVLSTYFVNGFVFDNNLGKYIYFIDRKSSPPVSNQYLQFFFEVNNKGQINETLSPITESYYSSQLNFSFEKELNTTTLFSIQASANVVEQNFNYPVNPTLNNSTYKFALDNSGRFGPYYLYGTSSQTPVYYSITTDGKKVYFEDPNTNYESNGGYFYGNLIKVINADGSIGNNPPYDQIVLSRSNINYELFFRNKAGLDLSSSITLPGDVFTVTNYQKNATTGIITFDFSATIGALGRTNSTGNPLTITGKFNSGKKVYSNVVSRKG